uniref:UDP-glucose:glycoprotein glucosyltransferase n=1 Tax=Kwoniella dejecticola CBS 10117 TaxID=1296121 RepID=A0A1A6A7X6_9TREE|nr:UDP-glucose:glycoprotein glucosyltransferase [Kwoniella dejecticola CBS 10117]OBR86156.1 UDP-glucose:glycoprotein glucosyltransferase [Kwoniella dejecticola CBS 10117]
MRTTVRSVALLGLLSSLAGSARAGTPPVSISLETAWPAPPFLLEILETVYEESPSSYFPLLHLLPELSQDAYETDETLLNSISELISSHPILSNSISRETLNLALSLHTSVPKILAQYSWYESSVRPKEVDLGVERCKEHGWVEWKGKGFCWVDDLRKDVEMSIEEGSSHVSQPGSLPFDHISSPLSTDSATAIVYYTPHSENSANLLNYLARHESQYPNFNYVIRYLPPTTFDAAKKTPLSGWGVEMALKKTDYLVVDDRLTGTSKSQAAEQEVAKHSKSSDSGIFDDALGQDPWSDLSTPLTSDEIRDLGLKATTLIKSSSNPLDALRELSQDFPKYSAALARRVEVSDGIRGKTRQMLQRGKAADAIYINGKAWNEGLDAYGLLRAIRSERHHVLSLTSLGLTPKQAIELISDPVIGEAQVEESPGEGVVDASDRSEGGDVIVYWNNIEKDKRYKNWPSSLGGFLRQVYPGQFHTVRRNTWNLVFVLDLAQIASLDIIANAISPMIQRGLPIRFGVVPMFEPGKDDLSFHMAKIFHYAVQTFGRGATKDLFLSLAGSSPHSLAVPGTVTLDSVRNAYDMMAFTSPKAALPFDELLSTELYDAHLEKTASYMNRLMATKEESKQGHLFINGKHTIMGGHWTAIVQSEMATQLAFLQEQLMTGQQPEDVSNFFYDLPSTSKRRNKLITPGQGEGKLKVFNLIDIFEGDVTKRLTTDFVYPAGEGVTPVTMWVIGDLDTSDGRRVVEDALKHLQTPDGASRLGFVHVPIDDPTIPRSKFRLSTALYQLHAASLLSKATPQEIFELLESLDRSNDHVDRLVIPAASDEEYVETKTDGETCVTFKLNDEQTKQYMDHHPLLKAALSGATELDIAASAEFWKVGGEIAKKLGLKDGSPHLLVNGRLVGPLTPQNFILEDFDALEAYEYRKRVKPVIDLVQTMYEDISVFDRSTLSSLLSIASSVIASSYKPDSAEGIFLPAQVARSRVYTKLDDGTMSFTLGDADRAILDVATIVDPISENAQKWSTILQTLSEMENVAISVYLEPQPQMTEVKLKRFYRSSIPSKLSFDVDGNVIAPGVTFQNLPSSPIYTLGLDAPPSWIVSPRTSPYDLDNLVLSNVHSPIHISFTLKQLLIEGHARESTNAPPRGLQLQLTTNGSEVASDTSVMANLGYFQFKATPGVYDLSIRPGRGREVYELESVGSEGWDSEGVNITGSGVILDSFEGNTILPRFGRREGMERADVLEEEERKADESFAGAVFSKMKSMVGLSTEVLSTKPKSRHADINIFTVASGLLYERFASIMILSVMKHTDSTVKFWFIENFLSPTFIEFIPELAEEYGFQYEFVTYKWPHWLRAQTEKQRIIWAYKILFLDVLFPQDLDKVIFVDADQIVRTDMKELVDVDLHGRVYGYAPMGDSRTEMEGFRFWKTGYWRDALRGRPYHISALYVVDLKRFRQLATGDRLRGQYHALSADPGSLANLDQDLPNSMQDTIPIWTLDQDWLWCQTWCSDESLSTAKTIDLCQNPLTKEPKLVRARQIPEWDLYDREIASFAARLQGEEVGVGALAASVDDLASEANGAHPAGQEKEPGLSIQVDVDLEALISDDDGEEEIIEDLLEESRRLDDEL